MDLSEPFRTKSVQGHLICLGVIDDYSSCAIVFFMKNMNETLAKFQEFHGWLEKQSGKVLENIRTDGGEFINKEFNAYSTAEEWHRKGHYCFPFLSTDGKIERWNRRIQEHSRAMLTNSGLYPGLGNVQLQQHVMYKGTSMARVKWKDSTWTWTGRHVPVVSYFRILGCIKSKSSKHIQSQ